MIFTTCEKDAIDLYLIGSDTVLYKYRFFIITVYFVYATNSSWYFDECALKKFERSFGCIRILKKKTNMYRDSYIWLIFSGSPIVTKKNYWLLDFQQ